MNHNFLSIILLCIYKQKRNNCYFLASISPEVHQLLALTWADPAELPTSFCDRMKMSLHLVEQQNPSPSILLQHHCEEATPHEYVDGVDYGHQLHHRNEPMESGYANAAASDFDDVEASDYANVEANGYVNVEWWPLESGPEHIDALIEEHDTISRITA